MAEVTHNNNIIVLINANYSGRLEQLNLNNEEQAAVLGFIREMKELNGKKIETISGATRFVSSMRVRNSNWDTAGNSMENRNNNAERVLNQ
jgi:hypothetical protein